MAVDDQQLINSDELMVGQKTVSSGKSLGSIFSSAFQAKKMMVTRGRKNTAVTSDFHGSTGQIESKEIVQSVELLPMSPSREFLKQNDEENIPQVKVVESSGRLKKAKRFLSQVGKGKGSAAQAGGKVEVSSAEVVKVDTMHDDQEIEDTQSAVKILNQIISKGQKSVSRPTTRDDITNIRREDSAESLDSPTRHYLENVAVPKTRKKLAAVTDDILSVTIHTTDKTDGSPLLTPHPVVQVYVCDANTGDKLKKSSLDRKVTSFYELGHVDIILPVMTQPFDRRKRRSLQCSWEEEIIFNESIEYLFSLESEVVLFFQLMDFPESNSNGWITFAWAFLRLSRSNVGRLRLQLYRPSRAANVGLADLHSLWRSGWRRKYPSTLHVTVRSDTPPPVDLPPAIRSRSVTQREEAVGSQGIEGLLRAIPENGSTLLTPNHGGGTVHWSRRPHQSCVVPEAVRQRLGVGGEQGCLVLRFSHNGMWLACGSGNGPLCVYHAVTGEPVGRLTGHLGLIYDLCWDHLDRRLLSASADATARVWSLATTDPASNQVITGDRILQHPTYVYAAVFSPTDGDTVVTGCYDNLLRVWSTHGAVGGEYLVVQELTDHLAFPTALCFKPDGTLIYSGDSQGVIIVWDVHIQQIQRENNSISGTKGKLIENRKRSRVSFRLILNREVRLAECQGVTINALVWHHGGFRLLIHTRDSHLRLVNHRQWTVTHRLQGALNLREQIRGCLSPCGTWVIAGGEDSAVHVWHADSGQLVSTLTHLPLDGTISCVDFHPFDHAMAVTSYSPGAPVLVLGLADHQSDADTLQSVIVMGGRSLAVDSPRADRFLDLPVEGRTSASPLLSIVNSPVKIEAKSLMNDMKNDVHTTSDVARDVGGDVLRKLDSVLRRAAEEPLSIGHRRMSTLENPMLGKLACVMFNFRPSKSDELSVKKDDIVLVLDHPNGLWSLVSTVDSQQRGLVPSSYLSVASLRDEKVATMMGGNTDQGTSSSQMTPGRGQSRARSRRHRVSKTQSPV